MPNVYGIESEHDCRQKIDELLGLHRRAEQSMRKETIAVLKSALKAYYKQGNDKRMSTVERQSFWPAIQHAYVEAPNLSSPGTWRDGLYNIHLNLTYYRPKEK